MVAFTNVLKDSEEYINIVQWFFENFERKMKSLLK